MTRLRFWAGTCDDEVDLADIGWLSDKVVDALDNGYVDTVSKRCVVLAAMNRVLLHVALVDLAGVACGAAISCVVTESRFGDLEEDLGTHISRCEGTPTNFLSASYGSVCRDTVGDKNAQQQNETHTLFHFRHLLTDTVNVTLTAMSTTPLQRAVPYHTDTVLARSGVPIVASTLQLSTTVTEPPHAA